MGTRTRARQAPRGAAASLAGSSHWSRVPGRPGGGGCGAGQRGAHRRMRSAATKFPEPRLLRPGRLHRLPRVPIDPSRCPPGLAKRGLSATLPEPRAVKRPLFYRMRQSVRFFQRMCSLSSAPCFEHVPNTCSSSCIRVRATRFVVMQDGGAACRCMPEKRKRAPAVGGSVRKKAVCRRKMAAASVALLLAAAAAHLTACACEGAGGGAGPGGCGSAAPICTGLGSAARAHALTHAAPTSAELLAFARWRSWARRQVVRALAHCAACAGALCPAPSRGRADARAPTRRTATWPTRWRACACAWCASTTRAPR